MLGAFAQSCCCGDPGCEKDCIWGTEIESGCCHKDDTLLFWAERPLYTQKTHTGCFVGFGPSQRFKEYCCTRTYGQEGAVQAIYHYHSCWWRCIPVDIEGIKAFDGLAEMCPPATCQIDPSTGAQTPCYPYINCSPSIPCSGQGCCNDPTYNFQPWNNNCLDCCENCNDQGMSVWRRKRMAVTDQWKWIVEAVCHKNGQALGSGADCDTISYSGGSFSNCTRLGGLNAAHQMIAVVHFERWWRIADCPEGSRIYVPGCSPGVGGFNCGGNLCNSVNLVPKWWIFACSGVPLYAGDLIDAVRFNVITSAEATQLLEDLFGTCTHPDQAVLKKLAVAGYIRANDWRDEQRTAYQELDARFPGAGYNACIQNVDQMHTLGPFRKRMTYKTVGTSNQPLLRKNDVVNNPNLLPLQADCFINFPGGTQADYDYWCQRQWVYFRGRPGGWTWADWDANLCPGNELLSILIGDTRGSTNCIDAIYGACRSPSTNVPCGCCNTQAAIGKPVDCEGCNEYQCPTPIPDCNPIVDICEVLSTKPYCEGVHFKYTVYRGDSSLVAPDGSGCNPGPTCGQCVQVKCQQTVHSFLIEASRSVDSWLDSIPYTCRPEKPALPVFNTWNSWAKSHPAPESSVCSFAITPASDTQSWCWGCGCQATGAPPCPQSTYTSRMCCGGMCADNVCDCDPTAVDPWTGPQGPACPSRNDCPPHSTEGQIGCIGFTPDCP